MDGLENEVTGVGVKGKLEVEEDPTHRDKAAMNGAQSGQGSGLGSGLNYDSLLGAGLLNDSTDERYEKLWCGRFRPGLEQHYIAYCTGGTSGGDGAIGVGEVDSFEHGLRAGRADERIAADRRHGAVRDDGRCADPIAQRKDRDDFSDIQSSFDAFGD